MTDVLLAAAAAAMPAHTTDFASGINSSQCLISCNTDETRHLHHSLLVRLSTINCLKRPVSKMNYYVQSGVLNSAH